VSGAFDKLMKVFPASLAAAMLGGILFHFVADVAGAASQQALLVVPMTVLFFIGRKLFPRFALLAAIGLGLAIASWQGLYGTAGSWQGSSGPLFTMPQWSWTAFVNLALPLALLALTSQFCRAWRCCRLPVTTFRPARR
jgi:benzoate membrane transport protein